MTVPGIQIDLPLDRSVYQRQADNHARIQLNGRVTGLDIRKNYYFEIKVTTANDSITQTRDSLHFDKNGRFTSELVLPAGGWYKVEYLVSGDNQNTISKATIEHVGVGEVFITAGQSNAANSGATRTSPKSDLVSARSRDGWTLASDPQPVASGEGGSPWPTMADILVEKLNVPIGLVSTGVGGTTVESWMPQSRQYRWQWLARLFKAGNFARLEWALNMVGFHSARAILWHQGESDAIAQTIADIYATRLRAVIAGTRAISGWKIPWIIARASFHTTPSEGDRIAIVTGQEATIDPNDNIFEGPSTDDLQDMQWRAPDLVHFNESGLKEHGTRWARAVLNVFFNHFSRSED